MLEITNVTKKYDKKIALDSVNLTIGPGEIVGLFGENGAGKTTLMKCILDLVRYEGKITLEGSPITRKNIDRLSFATVEHSFFPNMTPKEHREFYQDHFDRFRQKRFEMLMDFFALAYNKPLRTFSTGQQNQFEVIMALCQGADYILMDEPFSGSDIFNREDFYKLMIGILEPEETILLSTHLIEEVSEVIGRAVLIRQGKIIGDTTSDNLEEEGTTLLDWIKEIYGYRQEKVSEVITRLEENRQDG